jgi:hypothetical protein
VQRRCSFAQAKWMAAVLTRLSSNRHLTEQSIDSKLTWPEALNHLVSVSGSDALFTFARTCAWIAGGAGTFRAWIHGGENMALVSLATIKRRCTSGAQFR